MGLSELDVVKSVLAEHHLEPERALAGLLRTLVDHHFRSRLRRPADNSGPISLVSLLDASSPEPLPRSTVLEELVALLQTDHANDVRVRDGMSREGATDDEAPGLVGDDLAHVQAALLHLVAESLAVGERQAGLEPEEETRGDLRPPPQWPAPDDDRPPMRLVRD
jgi:hypothetical protein